MRSCLGGVVAKETRVLSRRVPHGLHGAWCGRGSFLASACDRVDAARVIQGQKGARISVRHLVGDSGAAHHHAHTHRHTHTDTHTQTHTTHPRTRANGRADKRRLKCSLDDHKNTSVHSLFSVSLAVATASLGIYQRPVQALGPGCASRTHAPKQRCLRCDSGCGFVHVVWF